MRRTFFLLAALFVVAACGPNCNTPYGGYNNGYYQQQQPGCPVYPNAGYPNTGYPNNQYPTTGYPNYPTNGYPNTGMPGYYPPPVGYPNPQPGYSYPYQGGTGCFPGTSNPMCYHQVLIK